MSGRDEAIAAFLAAQGYGDTPPVLLAGDASGRKYYRPQGSGDPVVLMDAPPPGEDVRPFMALAGHLIERGFSAPRILAADKGAGFLLLEDLGDDSYNRLITAAAEKEQPLYEAAIDLLVALQSGEAPSQLAIDHEETLSLATYDEELLLQEAALFTNWYLPALSGERSDALAEEFADLLRPMLQPLFAEREVLVLRDYHADNLMWLAARQGTARVGLLDFQDAGVGHPAYDLVSLLQDARREVPQTLEEAMIGRFLDRQRETGREIDDQAFRRAYALLGVQRNAKIIGIFTRLWKRDRKPAYLAMIPRVWGLLERSLQQGGFTALSAFFDQHAPAALRRTAPTPETLCQ